MRICTFAFDAFGDMTLREPLFRTLLTAGHEVAAVTRTEYTAILPYISPAIVSIPAIRAPTDDDAWAIDFNGLATRVVDWQPDAILALEASVFATPSGYGFRLFLERFNKIPRIGMTFAEAPKRADELGYSQVVKVGAMTHECAKYQKLLSGWLKINDQMPHPILTIPKCDIVSAQQQLENIGLRSKRYAVCSPAGATLIKNKGLPTTMAVIMAKHLFERYGLPTLFLGVESERAELQKITEELSQMQIAAHVWIGNNSNFSLLMGLLHEAALYFGCDTGPMHFSAALNLPVLAIFGGGTYPRFLPATENGIALTQKMPCSPCAWQCPYPAPPPCISLVRVEHALHGLDQLMTGKVKALIKHLGPFDINWKR